MGQGLERLTDDPAYDDQGALSPDGKQLAFVSSHGNPGPDVYSWRVPVATSTETICESTSFPIPLGEQELSDAD
jgi:Tol biopolymer transport system component